MQNPFFFGYGSLVNAATHSYPSTFPATLHGWRRVWKHTSLRELAFLSVMPVQGHQIDGLIAEVPNSDWSALDVREAGYFRIPVEDAEVTHQAGRVDLQMYQTDPEHEVGASAQHPILLSYVDVVVQGFFNTFGEDGVTRFFETTDGWEAPILNDRSNPLYPRSQTLTLAETSLVDSHLDERNARIVSS
ncbi:gamma-glutamylcyclotransferase family protein [Litoreibacter janthinus]|uniref:Gamma-glutamyl cyclotransferase, AIG2-like n=1 Tax=Litoreibacter janthinus TaxID=670154 RepID=A0A1I6G6X8_9RHOB|nr:gamma-glutamylcyclotransferase family protein [Litoreibacter janthinus]SFR37942.1 Gamma-glutamyl cyclotransferase, AIG2-like [Litoreibacter janthinus]